MLPHSNIRIMAFRLDPGVPCMAKINSFTQQSSHKYANEEIPMTSKLFIVKAQCAIRHGRHCRQSWTWCSTQSTLSKVGNFCPPNIERRTSNFVERQSRPCRFGPVHIGDKVERTFDIRATKITNFRQSRPSWTCSTLATMLTATQSTKSNEPATVDPRQTGDKADLSLVLATVNFVVSVYPA